MTKFEYGGQVKLVQTIIKNLSDMGIDVTSFVFKSNEIKEKINKEILKINNNQEISEADKDKLISGAYDASYEDLKVLLEYLNKYTIYFQTVNKSHYIFDSQNEVNYSKTDISSLIEELIMCLDSIKSFKGLNEEEDNLLLDSLYKVIYDIMKVEYKSFGQSKLLEYCKKDKSHCPYINEYIVNDIAQLRNVVEDTNYIDLLVHKLNSEGKDTMYLDEELIRTISIYSSKEKYVKELMESIKQLISDTKKNNSNIRELKSDKSSKEWDKRNYESRLKEEKDYRKKVVIKDTIVGIISLACVATAVHYAPVLAKKEYYNTDTETYSTVNGYNIKKDEYLEEYIGNSNHPGVSTTVVVYEPWTERKSLGSKLYERKVKTLDLSKIEFDDIKEYVTFDAEALGYDYDVEKEQKEELILSDLYKEPITEVTKIVQDTEDVKVEEKPSAGRLVLVSFGLLAGYLFTMFILAAIDEDIYFDFIRSLVHMIKTLKDKSDLNSIYDSLNDLIRKLNKINEDLKLQQHKNIVNQAEYDRMMSIPENVRFLNEFQKGIDLLKEYSNEIEVSKKLTL